MELVDNKPIVSVIIPVFNAEDFLEKCVTSITSQTIFELQIILIDDGSTDKSGEICDYLAAKDRRIIVIHQDNLGVSAARNAGIRVARGAYITFVDADDILPTNAYENLLMCVKDNYLIMGRMQMISEEDELGNATNLKEKEISQNDFLMELFVEQSLPYLGYPWDKIYSRKIIEKYHLRFDERIKLNEDRLFVLSYVIHCTGVIFSNHIVYYYRQRKGGVIFSTRKNSNVSNSEMTVLKSFDIMQKICRNYSEELYYVCCRKSFESVLDLLHRVDKKDKEKKELLDSFLKKNSKICLQNPQYKIYDKLKIIGHVILRK